MSNHPQSPDGRYSLTPETPDGHGTGDATDATTAHHEELLRTEALAARRGNRLVARFAVVGLVAAVIVGVVTWRNSVSGSEVVQRREVVDASTGTGMPTRESRTTTSPRPSGTPDPVIALPGPSGGGVVPLSEDPYLPPNAWNGGQTLAPAYPGDSGSSPGGTGTAPGRGDGGTGGRGDDADTGRDNPDGDGGDGVPGLWPTDPDTGLPSLPGFPTGLPVLPSTPGSSGTPTSTDGAGGGSDNSTSPQPTESAEPSESPETGIPEITGSAAATTTAGAPAETGTATDQQEPQSREP